MAAYCIFQVTVNDPTRYAEYAKHTPRIINKFGGKMIVRGGDMEVLEGQAQGQRVVVIEFPDRAAVKAFYSSPEYQTILKIRQPVSVANGIVVDGVAPGAWDAAVAESNKHG